MRRAKNASYKVLIYQQCVSLMHIYVCMYVYVSYTIQIYMCTWSNEGAVITIRVDQSTGRWDESETTAVFPEV